MTTSEARDLATAAVVMDGGEAARLLARSLSLTMVRALALRADQLRFEHSWAAVGVAEAALAGYYRLPPRQRRPGIACLAWRSTVRSCVLGRDSRNPSWRSLWQRR